MRVFITGASGWIGSAVTDELLAHGHAVIGFARSDSAAEALSAKGATVQRGDLDDLDSIRSGVDASEAVIHLANKHDFSNPAVSNKAERDAVETIGESLTGSDRPFILASGMAGAGDGRLLTESDRSPFTGPDSMRGGSENRAFDYVEHGVRAISARFTPTVHGAGDHGFIAALVGIARERGFAGYVGDGENHWPAVHRSDAARMVRLGLESAPAGSILHAVAEEGVTTRSIAEALGRGLDLPVESVPRDAAMAHFGWLGGFFGMDIMASSAITQQLLGWSPTGPTLIEDLDGGSYFRN